ncbi:hypothetical protein CNR22_01630 [Sphingobacteriaceae bacterium]|nr:hypothetical protein CNR22_01630 [Sphingobacteriaceae bacterium]
MKLLTTATEKLLLEQALEALHQQCRSWINQIALWEDEKKFFTDLIATKLLHTTEEEKTDIKNLLERISSEELVSLRKELLDHETFLYTLLTKPESEDERDYRNQHELLKDKFQHLDNHLRSVKKSVFALVKVIDHNFLNGNKTLHTIYERRAVRKYKTAKVEKHLVQEVLKAAAMAPSAINRQPWKFYVLSDSAKLKSYSHETIKAADKVYHDLLLGLLNEEDPVYHGAPVVIFITAPKNHTWAGVDIGLCGQNLMLAAKSLGLDTCPVGLAKFIENTPVYSQLRIPDSEQIHLAIVLGYGDEQPAAHERKTDNILFL